MESDLQDARFEIEHKDKMIRNLEKQVDNLKTMHKEALQRNKSKPKKKELKEYEIILEQRSLLPLNDAQNSTRNLEEVMELNQTISKKEKTIKRQLEEIKILKGVTDVQQQQINKLKEKKAKV